MEHKEIGKTENQKSYHHGDLRNALIEAGIKMVHEEGEAQLSLRKVAKVCGVSNAAPYAHFAGKEEMILAMQEHVNESFMKRLTETVEKYKDDTEGALVAMGRDYVRFFIEFPYYFSFLFSQPCMKVNLSIADNGDENYPPYELMKTLLTRWNGQKEIKLGVDELEIQIVRMWVTVHGLASIATMKHVTWNREW